MFKNKTKVLFTRLTDFLVSSSLHFLRNDVLYCVMAFCDVEIIVFARFRYSFSSRPIILHYNYVMLTAICTESLLFIRSMQHGQPSLSASALTAIISESSFALYLSTSDQSSFLLFLLLSSTIKTAPKRLTDGNSID